MRYAASLARGSGCRSIDEGGASSSRLSGVRRGAPSPDEWDAVALTFAEPVAPPAWRRRIEYPPLGIA
jgi:hypothetical protein